MYRGFGYIAYNCRNVKNRGEKRSTPMPSNKFEVLQNRVINIEEGSGNKIKKIKI